MAHLSFDRMHDLVRRHVFRRPRPDLESVAGRVWEIAPGHTSIAPRAVFLPGQLERVIGWPEFFSEHPRREMEGGYPVNHAPTRAFLIDDGVLAEGSLYKAGAVRYFNRPRSNRPYVVIESEIERGAIYCTESSKRFFAHFLLDECVTYPLAAAEGTPVTTATPLWTDVPYYERKLGMEPARVLGARLKKAVLFEDYGQNRDKSRRAGEVRSRLLAGIPFRPHPGVVVLRRNYGARRTLLNELELAGRLKEKRGFRIVDPGTMDVAAIVEACAGAEAVVGVEGSGLMHGINLLGPGGRVLTLQPPTRFVSIYKHMTDRDGQLFGFVVGTPAGDDFSIDPDEVERTLDAFPARCAEMG
jgi:hypothetical protein